jgi:eukaryotic-like serine/threonine-protein kinase
MKSANVFVTDRGQPKVVDFGLAKMMPGVEGETPARSLSATDAIVGTLPYMAPEQLLGEKVDARTDIHALGALLYEMSTGVRPYRKEPLPRLIDEILHTPPQPPSQLNPAIGSDLEAVVLKLPGEKSGESLPDHGGRSEPASLVDA